MGKKAVAKRRAAAKAKKNGAKEDIIGAEASVAGPTPKARTKAPAAKKTKSSVPQETLSSGNLPSTSANVPLRRLSRQAGTATTSSQGAAPQSGPPAAVALLPAQPTTSTTREASIPLDDQGTQYAEPNRRRVARATSAPISGNPAAPSANQPPSRTKGKPTGPRAASVQPDSQPDHLAAANSLAFITGTEQLDPQTASRIAEDFHLSTIHEDEDELMDGDWGNGFDDAGGDGNSGDMTFRMENNDREESDASSTTSESAKQEGMFSNQSTLFPANVSVVAQSCKVRRQVRVY